MVNLLPNISQSSHIIIMVYITIFNLLFLFLRFLIGTGPGRATGSLSLTTREEYKLLKYLDDIFSDPRRGCYMGLHAFIFFFSFFLFFSATILSGPYLWSRYSFRLQTECAAWSCSLILHCCLPSNSLRYLFIYFLFFYFFPPRFCPGHISGTVTYRDSKLSVLLGPAV